MGVEENKELARRALVDVWSAGGSVPAGEVYARDVVSHQHSHPTIDDVHGLDALEAFIAEFHRAFPDFVDTVDRQVGEGDLVVTQFTSSGTHDGELLNIPATGTHVSWMGIEIARAVDGRIVETWVSWDMYGMLQQLGAVPSLG